jgi:hypothetical protein
MTFDGRPTGDYFYRSPLDRVSTRVLALTSIGLLVATVAFWLWIWNTPGAGDMFMLFIPLGLGPFCLASFWGYKAARRKDATKWVKYLAGIDIGATVVLIALLVWVMSTFMF